MPLLTTFAADGVSAYGFTRGGAAAAPAYELISTTILSSAAASVTISSIPSGYKHLQVRTMIWNDNSNGLVRMRVNGDTGTNYSAHRLGGNGSSVASASYLSNPFMYVADLTASSSTTQSPGIIDILDYASTTKNKTVRGFSSFVSTMEVHLYSGLWMNTAAITSLTFLDNANYQINAGSRFSLYGIKG